MCKYCEEILSTYDGNLNYIPNGAYQIKENSEAHQWELTSSLENISQGIQYCPWCGRDLDLPKYQDQPSVADEIARLEGRVDTTNLIIREICRDLALHLNRNGNKYMLADKLNAYANKM